MKHNKILPFVFFLAACQPEPEINKELTEKMVGEWRNVDLKITMNSYNNTDSVRTLEVTEATWEEKMKIRPIRTHFNADGTYNSEHINLNDSLIYNPAGTWIILGDSIIMTDTFPTRGLTYKYKVSVKDNMATFYGKEDCDFDGAADDDYYGTQRKQ